MRWHESCLLLALVVVMFTFAGCPPADEDDPKDVGEADVVVEVIDDDMAVTPQDVKEDTALPEDLFVPPDVEEIEPEEVKPEEVKPEDVFVDSTDVGQCQTPSYTDDCSEVGQFQCGFEGYCEDGTIHISWHEHAFCDDAEEIYEFSCSYKCPGTCSDEISGGWPVDGTEMVELYCIAEAPECPAEPPFGSEACQGELTCTYGEECCCGECHDSLVCQCMGGEFGCYYTDACMVPWCVEPPCCEPGDDAGCKTFQEGAICAHSTGAEYGKCVQSVEYPLCWVDAGCPEGEKCQGAAMCPCDADCDMEDMPGACVDPLAGGGVGDPCGPSGGDCQEALVCCYPCGIPDCQWKCQEPCDAQEPWCADGCPMLP